MCVQVQYNMHKNRKKSKYYGISMRECRRWTHVPEEDVIAIVLQFLFCHGLLFWEVDKYINADTQQRSVKSSEYLHISEWLF